MNEPQGLLSFERSYTRIYSNIGIVCILCLRFKTVRTFRYTRSLRHVTSSPSRGLIPACVLQYTYSRSRRGVLRPFASAAPRCGVVAFIVIKQKRNSTRHESFFLFHAFVPSVAKVHFSIQFFNMIAQLLQR